LVAIHSSGLDSLGAVKAPQTRYLHKDNLGSVDTITDAVGNIVDRMSFDPFGGRRQNNWREATAGVNLIPVLTNRGFTGHEHLDDVGLIHMNGRVYDAALGRFLSADPNVQAPYATQNLNRYSYAMNNPLKYTDPSGFFFKKLFRSIKKAVSNAVKFVKKYWRQIVSIVIMVYLPGYIPEAWGPVVTGAITGGAAGFVSTGSLKGAVMGAVSGAAFGALHGFDGGVLGSVESIQKIGMHGLVGGITSKMQGGKFGQGFLSAAFTQAVSIGAKGTSLFKTAAGRALNAAERANNAIIAAAIGGTAALVGGGKFMNGAVTGAFSRMLNDDADWNRKAIRAKRVVQIASDKGSYMKTEYGEWQAKPSDQLNVDILDIIPATRTIRALKAIDTLMFNDEVRSVYSVEYREYTDYEYDTLYDLENGKKVNVQFYQGSRRELSTYEKPTGYKEAVGVQSRSCMAMTIGC
ncbi:RHS repeat-associated core domain-containing protein, partial [Amphritea pacifica]|uniref:RHS repeat domain-containing protein n=1 Tax=Amphritea pacifica TaxID=2811233 RepID=UPI001D916773|nr:hypothetical protein [Amphritea pacifica]